MTYDIANIILDQIKGLVFFDKYTGLVRKLTKKDQDANGRTVTKVFPVGCDVTEEECNVMKMSDLVPNTKYKSIHYFEDGGTRFVSWDGRYIQYESILRLVGWLNLKAVGKEAQCSVSALAVTNILKSINYNRFNVGPYTKIHIVPASQAIKDSRIFQPYTYDEATNQYLIHPFDYYALDFRVTYSILPECIEDFELEPISCP